MEQAFIEMDAQIARERATYSIPGGCTAVAAVLMMGKLYVANAGDSRAMICREAPKVGVNRCLPCKLAYCFGVVLVCSAVCSGTHVRLQIEPRVAMKIMMMHSYSL